MLTNVTVAAVAAKTTGSPVGRLRPPPAGSTAILGQPLQQIDDRIVHPSVRDEIPMPTVAAGNDCHTSSPEPMIDLGAHVDVMGGENILQLGVFVRVELR